MQTYQIKVLPKGTFLYGGSAIAIGNDADQTVLMIKNDRFGEPVRVKVQRQKPTQPLETLDFGVLDPDQVLTLNLQSVLRVEAKTLAPNCDSYISCAIMVQET